MISEYDPDLFKVERLQAASGRLGSFILGESRLGVDSAPAWVEIPAATFTYSMDYDPDENGTLIIGSETASFSVSVVGSSTFELPAEPSDKIRAVYQGEVIFSGIVDSTKVRRTALSPLPYRWQVDFSATLVGTYALAMTKIVCYGDLPEESAWNRLSRWVRISEEG
jgi:hypothetical protein